MNVLYELRCPECKCFISGFEVKPQGKVRGRCRGCRLTFDGAVLELTVDILKVRMRTFA